MNLIFGGWIGWVFTPPHNGVNLYTQSTAKFRRWLKSFKPQRGKFTPKENLIDFTTTAAFQTPTG